MSASIRPGSAGADYSEAVTIDATSTRIFYAISSVEGLRSWWTPLVSGSTDPGGDLTFEFDGLDESIVMHVDEAIMPTFVGWTCLANSGHPEWIGTRPTFRIKKTLPRGCVLDFRHIGLTRDLRCYRQCERGWHHFLASITAYSESGQGTPFGTYRSGEPSPEGDTVLPDRAVATSPVGHSPNPVGPAY